MADAGHDLPAVAPGAAEAQVARFQHDDVGDAFLGQLQRGVDAGEATADHDDVGLQIGFQRREAEVVLLGDGVVGGRLDVDHDCGLKR
ncbi:hypothetical protein D9M73_253160 [compost metagenome]